MFATEFDFFLVLLRIEEEKDNKFRREKQKNNERYIESLNGARVYFAVYVMIGRQSNLLFFHFFCSHFLPMQEANEISVFYLNNSHFIVLQPVNKYHRKYLYAYQLDFDIFIQSIWKFMAYVIRGVDCIFWNACGSGRASDCVCM